MARPLFCATAPIPLEVIPLAGSNMRLQVEDGIQIVGDFLLAPQADERRGELVGRRRRIVNQASSSTPDSPADRRQVRSWERRGSGSNQAHVQIAVQTDPVPAQIVFFRRLCLDRRLVGQIGRHRVHRIDSARPASLPSLPRVTSDASRYQQGAWSSPVLFVELPGLRLQIREFVGVRRRREGEDGGCRYKSLLHVGSPTKARQRRFAANCPITEPRMRTPCGGLLP